MHKLIKNRLDQIRKWVEEDQYQSGYGGIIELSIELDKLLLFIDADDTRLLEFAGVPEFDDPECEEFKRLGWSYESIQNRPIPTAKQTREAVEMIKRIQKEERRS